MGAKVPDDSGIKDPRPMDESLYCTLEDACSLLDKGIRDIRRLMKYGVLAEMPDRMGSSPVQVRLLDVLAYRSRLMPDSPTETDQDMVVTPGFLGNRCKDEAHHYRQYWRAVSLRNPTKVIWSIVTCVSCGNTWRTQLDYAADLPKLLRESP